jgi:hypothetical protein
MSPFSPTPEMIRHLGSTGSFLFYSMNSDIYISGTINQIKEQGMPFRLMTEVVNTFNDE